MAKSRSSVDRAKAFSHPLRVQIWDIMLDVGVISPNQLSQELDEPLGNVSYHVKALLDFDCVELVRTEPRRGAVEHFYQCASGFDTPFNEAKALDKILALTEDWIKGVRGAEPALHEIVRTLAKVERIVPLNDEDLPKAA